MLVDEEYRQRVILGDTSTISSSKKDSKNDVNEDNIEEVENSIPLIPEVYANRFSDKISSSYDSIPIKEIEFEQMFVVILQKSTMRIASMPC